MPRPVEALPCGSRSMMSTRSPIAASAVPRLIAVVVLPTPPFWLASARIRGFVSVMTMLSMQFVVAPLQGADFDDSSSGIGTAGQNYHLDVPIFSCLGQFSLYILPLQEQGFCTPFYHWGGQTDQDQERGERPGGHDVDQLRPARDEVLGAGVVDGGGCPAGADGFPQESC